MSTARAATNPHPKVAAATLTGTIAVVALAILGSLSHVDLGVWNGLIALASALLGGYAKSA